MATSKKSERSHDPEVRFDIDRSLFFKLMLLVNFTARPFAARYGKKYRISLTEWRVLFVLAQREDLAASDLGDFLGLDKMAVSRAVRALETSRRLLRVPDQNDGRRRTLLLTKAGRDLYETISPSGRERERMLLSSIDNKQTKVLENLLDRLLNAARALPDFSGQE